MMNAEWMEGMQMLYKVRMPFIALFVCGGLHKLSAEAGPTLGRNISQFWLIEAALIFTTAAVTGYMKLHFTQTWWLLIIFAYFFQLPFTLHVATVTAMGLVVVWYGLLCCCPQAIEALWGGSQGKRAQTVKNLMPTSGWIAWDLSVHAIPSVLLMSKCSRDVGVHAPFVAMLIHAVWLIGLGLRMGKVVNLSLKFRDVEDVYKFEFGPAADQLCRWIFHGSVLVSSAWAAYLVLPGGWNLLATVMIIAATWMEFSKALETRFSDIMPARVAFFGTMHILAIVGLSHSLVHESRGRLLVEYLLMWEASKLGITCGSHRLWAHRSYEAKAPFRAFLMLLSSFANQGTIFHWARDHRNHHKYTDTTADPHDTNRGFFFAHIGWLLLKKHEDIRKKGGAIPCADLLADPLVMFQKKAEETVMFNQFVCFGLPAIYGHVVYGDWFLGFIGHGILRWMLCLHGTWCINSVAHWFGDRPYNPKASARENLVASILAAGEGWHSWHHKFPYDYAASEFGVLTQHNPSKLLIDFGAVLGQVSGRKRADKVWGQIRKRQECEETAAAESTTDGMDKAE